MKETKNIELTLIIPVLNEQENVPILAKEINEAFQALPSYEVIWVDDGSKDRTLSELVKISQNFPSQKYISLMRTSGQSTAIMAGIEKAKGQFIATLDGDLQNSPVDLIEMYKRVKTGEYDMMVGWREKRWKENLIRRLPSLIANMMIKRAFHTRHLHDAGCPVKVAKASLFKEIKLYGELHRFIAYIAHDLGGNVGEMRVKHSERKFGTTHYGLSRTFKVIIDIFNLKLLMMRKVTPTQIFAPIIVLSLGISTLTALLTLVLKFKNGLDITGNPLFIISVISFLMSIQFFIYGFLGELLIRTYYESGHKKTYIIRESNI